MTDKDMDWAVGALGEMVAARDEGAIEARTARMRAEIAELRARTEQAERERDEARQQGMEGTASLAASYDMSCRQRDAEKAARECAEADNAELLKQAQRMAVGGADDECVWCGHAGDHRPRCPVGQMLAGAHPGAALLERLRALEDAGGYVLRDAFRPQTPELVDANGERVVRVGWEWIERLRVALDKECEECGLAGTHKVQCGRRA